VIENGERFSQRTPQNFRRGKYYKNRSNFPGLKKHLEKRLRKTEQEQLQSSRRKKTSSLLRNIYKKSSNFPGGPLSNFQRTPTIFQEGLYQIFKEHLWFSRRAYLKNSYSEQSPRRMSDVVLRYKRYHSLVFLLTP